MKGKKEKMTDFQIKDKYNVDDFRKIMAVLRAPGGCPWDAEQTHESIRRNVIEEAYELAQAIDTGDKENLREELGDLLMQVIFHAQMEEEIGSFDLDDIADTACKKLVYRHPHVFGNVVCENSQEVLETWDAVKRIEKKQKTTSSAMEGVAETLPALMRAEKVQKKAAQSGLELPDISRSFASLKDEMDKLETCIINVDAEGVQNCVGELIFAAVRVARHSGVDAEAALHRACEKAIYSVREMEKNTGMSL